MAYNVKNLSRRVRDVLKNDKKAFLLLAVLMLVGFVLGFIFYDVILASELIFWNDKEGILFVVKETKFFPYFFSLLWLYLKALLCSFGFSLIKKGKWGIYILAVLNGLTFATLIVVIMDLLGVIGMGYIAVSILIFLAVLFILFFSYRAIEKCQCYGHCFNKTKILFLAKYYLLLLLFAVIFSLLITLVVFIFLRLLFSIV